jgi:hypothetical protein
VTQEQKAEDGCKVQTVVLGAGETLSVYFLFF